jgi:hypothetical protein
MGLSIQRYGILSQGGVNWTPASISGLDVWLGDYVNGGVLRTTLSNATAITQWDDLSGNARHFTKAAGTNPRYLTATNAISFDTGGVTTDSLECAPFSWKLGVVTQIFVWKTSETNRYYVICRNNVNSSYFNYLYPNGAATSVDTSLGSTGFNASIGTSWGSTGSFVLASKRIDGTHATHVIRKNGSDLSRGTVYGSANPGTAATTNYIRIGQNGSSGGIEYKELIQYNSCLSTANIALVESYLNTKYSIY